MPPSPQLSGVGGQAEQGRHHTTHRLALLQHGKHEQDVAMARLQAPVVKAAILLLVPRVEDGWQGREAGGDIGPGHLQLAGVAQAAPLQPRDVLDKL